MDVSACAYARFFQELGEPELGYLLLCSADCDLGEEMDDAELARSQSWMEGASHCDFQYRFPSRQHRLWLPSIPLIGHGSR